MAGPSQSRPDDPWTVARRKTDIRLSHAFWQLDGMRETFPLLPLLAALTVFVLFAVDGQLREIYLSTLEQIDAEGLTNWRAAAPIGFAVAGLGLLSALLFQAQCWLTRAPPKPLLPDRTVSAAGSIGQRVQRTTAIALALAPWFGIVVGLVRAELYVDDIDRLFANMGEPGRPSMSAHLPTPSVWWIAAAALILGMANAGFIELHRKYSLREIHKHSDELLRAIIVATTPAAAACMFLLLIDYQLADLKEYLIACCAIAALGAIAAYYFVYSRLRLVPVLQMSRRQGLALLHRHRQAFMVAWLLLPWALVAICFAAVSYFDPAALKTRWAAIPIAMTAAIVAALFFVQLLDYLRRTAPDSLSALTIALILVLAAAAWILSVRANAGTIVLLYRIVGPLATTTLGLVFLLSILVLLARLSQISRYPALSLAVIAAIVIVILPVQIFVLLVLCVIIAGAALLADRPAIAGVAAVVGAVALVSLFEARSLATVALPDDNSTQRAGGEHASVCRQFEKWLEQKTWVVQKRPSDLPACPPRMQLRRAPAEANQAAQNSRTKAFIIAVEGGGIYAASAASLFLAKMQERAPNFSDHVFAISGVSGGAIGATVFAALDAAQNQAGSGNPARSARPGDGQSSSGGGATSRCPAPTAGAAPPQRTMLEAVRAIMEDDHYSPVVGSIFPELLAAPTGRAEALAASFACSVSARSPAAGRTINGAFAAYWSETGHLPALVLNATWVETGSRAAFAPFPLHDIDQSLYSFDDKTMPQITGAVVQPRTDCDDSVLFCASLINAAVVSARFPLMLPPLSLSVKASNHVLRWNFVDGGYADNSGAATALALYQALIEIAKSHNVELQIILVTSINPQPDTRSIDGTVFRDTLAPINAILHVRQAESMAAVARACNYFYRDRQACQDHTGESGDDLQIIKIDDTTYGLPLGWELSRTTFDIISWMLGQIESDRTAPCNDYPTLPDPVRSEERNSCVLSTIALSLKNER